MRTCYVQGKFHAEQAKFNSGAGEQNDIRKFAKSGYETFHRFHLFCIRSGVNRL